MDLVIPRGTRLFHGTLESFDPADLTVGGYDNVLWTADNACIAQSYIPCSGGSSLVAIEYLDRPSQDRSTQAIQARIGLDFGYGTPRGPEFDKSGRAVSWRIPAPWLEENCNDFWRRKAALKQKVIEAGWLPRSENSDVFEFKFHRGQLLEPGQCAEGRLFIITVEQDLKIYDMTSGESREGDLTDVDYHKLGSFRAAEKSGYDGVKINDYCQSELWGNFGHRSVGIFKGSIGKLSWDVIPAKNFDWEDLDTVRRGLTPEYEAWLVEQAMARRNPRRRNTDGEVRALERKVFTGEGDDEDRQRLCVWWERTRLGLPIRKPEPQPHPVQDPNAKGGWSQILEIDGRWHLKDAWDRSSNGVLEARDIEEDVHELLQDKAPEIEEVRRITFLEKPEYESHADLTGEDWWTYLIRVEGSVPFSDEDEDVKENPRRRNRPALDLSRIIIRVCDGADRSRRSSRRAYAHTFCKTGPVVCVASEFFGLPAGHRDGVLAHEIGHLLAGPDTDEEAADRAFEAETGVRIRYKDGAHGRCLQWLGPKARKSLVGVFKFDFEGKTSDVRGPDDDAVRFFVKDASGKHELATLAEAEVAAAADPNADVWATDGRRRLGWRPMARNPKRKRGALVPLDKQIEHGVDLRGLRRNAVCPTCGATDAYKSPFSGRLECRVCDAVARRPKVGARVRLRQDVDRYPHFIAREGSTGVVSHSDDENFWVKLDDHLDGAEEWDNEVQWFGDFLRDVNDDLEVVTVAGARRNGGRR